MLERELKLYIPQTQQTAVQHAVLAFAHSQRIQLAARYFDSPMRCLAKQFAALRLRLEGDQWVQTLKMRGDDELSHLEYNHLRDEPVLDLNLYNNTPAEKLFTQLESPLEIRYQTDVTRTFVVITHQQTQIELAVDLGTIKAKNNTLTISEIEFELKSGAMSDVFTVANNWLAKYQLRLELRTKSERGDALYEYALNNPTKVLEGATAALAIAQQPYRLPTLTPHTETDIPTLYYTGASAFISQIIRNAFFLADVDFTHANYELQANYLTLLRVGMRRLRSCRQLFKPWLIPIETNLAVAMQTHFKQLGVWRDADMMALELQPKLIAAGLPQQIVSVKNTQNMAAQTYVASVEFQQLLLNNLANVVLQQSLTAEANDSINAQSRLARRLLRSLDRIQKNSARFEQLSITKQHDLRNQIKRLRYNLEILGYHKEDPLYAALAKAQHHLGDLCDAYVAQDWYSNSTNSSEQNTFAQDWLAPKIEKYQTKSKKTLALLLEQRLKYPVNSD